MPKFPALIAALAVAAALTGCPTETDRTGDENDDNQHTFYRTANTIALSGVEGGKSVSIEDRTLLGTRPVGTLGLVTPEIADGVRDAVNEVIAGGNEKALWVLARGIRIIAVDTAGSPVAGKTELSVYIGWLRADALSDALLAEIVGGMYGLGPRPGECDGDACACDGEGCGKEGCECAPPVTGPGKCDGDACDCGGGEECGKEDCGCVELGNGPVLTPWQPVEHQKIIEVGTVTGSTDQTKFTFYIVDKTRAGEKVDENGKNADGVLVEGMVTQAILDKFTEMIGLQEIRMGQNVIEREQFREVMYRGLRVIIGNTPPLPDDLHIFIPLEVTWDSLVLHIDFITARNVTQLRADFDVAIRQQMFPISQGGATGHAGVSVMKNP